MKLLTMNSEILTRTNNLKLKQTNKQKMFVKPSVNIEQNLERIGDCKCNDLVQVCHNASSYNEKHRISSTWIQLKCQRVSPPRACASTQQQPMQHLPQNNDSENDADNEEASDEEFDTSSEKVLKLNKILPSQPSTQQNPSTLSSSGTAMPMAATAATFSKKQKRRKKRAQKKYISSDDEDDDDDVE